MITTMKVTDADCDGGATHIVICDNDDISTAYYYADSQEEAEKYIKENFTPEEVAEYFGQ